MQTSPNPSEASTVTETNQLFPPIILKITGIATVILFLYSSFRHAAFQSTAYDLGIYDQIIYLISQGMQPISSFLGFHFLGDHGAIAIYPLALLYKIYPSVYWLFLVQSACLTSGVLFTYRLAVLGGLNQSLSVAVSLAYLLYPEIFNINLFDFHPDVLAVPAFFGAILAAKEKKILWFVLSIFWILSCKAVFALTVIAIGIWLLLFEKRRWYGLTAIILGVAWFLIVTQLIIPYFSGNEAAGVSRYSYLGDSVLGVILNTFLKPQLILGKIVSLDSFVYLLEVAVAVIWWLNPRQFILLVPAIPTLLLNILSVDPMQRSLIYQYSLPVLPFLFLVVIATLAKQQPGLGNQFWRLWNKVKSNSVSFPNNKDEISQSRLFTIPNPKLPRQIILWSSLVFLLWGDHTQVLGYFTRLNTWQASQQAVTQIKTNGGVLTDNRLAPHFTHRTNIKLLNQAAPESDLSEFDYIILNLRHPWPDTKDLGEQYATQLKTKPNFKLTFENNNVLVFKKNS